MRKTINICMNLLISGRLSRPPSSVHCFRDVTLYASVFREMDVLLMCRKHNIDRNWRWLKQHGAFDFIQDIVEYQQEPGIMVSPVRPTNIHTDIIDGPQLQHIIAQLTVYTDW